MSASDIFVYNTEDSVKQSKVVDQPKNFLRLVDENHPLLREVLAEFDWKNPPINPNELASALVDTCKHHHGIGLSANQCGLPYRVFVMGAGEEYVAFFNPKVIATRDETHMTEGCLSFPFLGLKITRAKEVDVEYQDFNGVTRNATYIGVSARCFLHELDHMNGILYTDKAKPLALDYGMKKRHKTLKKLRLI
jgi:peptide deformylase